MSQRRIPAVFMRGGSSKGVFFTEDDLPGDIELRNRIFLTVLGSPDPYGRQLDGMGGGISSLSKVAIIGRSTHDGADVDFNFGQVAVGEPLIDYGGTCGNLSAAVGPFAIEQGLCPLINDSGLATVRIRSVNTGKLVVARFPFADGAAIVDGDFAIAGVAGTGAAVRLEFLDPGGAATGTLLPSGKPLDRLDVQGVGPIDVSMVDASNSCVFVRAGDLGLSGTETPQVIEADAELLTRLEAIRAAAGMRMGLGESAAAVSRFSAGNPKVAIVGPPHGMTLLDGRFLAAGAVDICARMMSMGKPHRAMPLTGAMCLAVAARIPGTVVFEAASGAAAGDADLRVGTPSGVLPVAAIVTQTSAGVFTDRVVVYRTARRLMEGSVVVPMSKLRGHS